MLRQLQARLGNSNCKREILGFGADLREGRVGFGQGRLQMDRLSDMQSGGGQRCLNHVSFGLPQLQVGLRLTHGNLHFRGY
ncbi:MAG: hypothetical protein SFU86_14550 [Pirellulaceae bacterium]|nr:hypothetical protein [Pirellulaceae bacterium]